MVHSILAWLHLGFNIFILNTVTWMREDACGSPVKNGHWLLEATQCFNQLQVHTRVKPSSSSRKGMVLPAAVRLGSPSPWLLSSGCHALSIGTSKGYSQSTFLPLQHFTCVFRTEPEFALPFLALSDESLFACQCLDLLFFLATSTFTSSTNHTLF